MSNAQRARRDQLVALPVRPGAVVMLGDSITEQGEWSELLPHVPVANRGVGGEVTSQLLHRVDGALRSPAAVIILIGTNDLSMGEAPRVIARNISKALDRIALRAPETPVVVQSVMPRQPKYANEIREINSRVWDAAAVRRVRYLDLWPVLSDGADSLRSEYTFDGLHLNGAGYTAWAPLLSRELAQLGIAGHM